MIGQIVPIPQPFAEAVVARRVRQMSLLATGDCDVLPPWLLNVRCAGNDRRPVGRLFPDGTVERYPSLRKAAQAADVNSHRGLTFLAVCGKDKQGCIWFDDA